MFLVLSLEPRQVSLPEELSTLSETPNTVRLAVAWIWPVRVRPSFRLPVVVSALTMQGRVVHGYEVIGVILPTDCMKQSSIPAKAVIS